MKVGMREKQVAGDVGAPECEVLARTRAFGGSEAPPSACFFLALTDILPSSSFQADVVASRAPSHQKRTWNACSIEAVIRRCQL